MIEDRNIGLLVALIISLHPLFYIVLDGKYRCRDGATLYLRNNVWSRVASNHWMIGICIAGSFLGIYNSQFWLILPLTIMTWKLFISDRFITLSRGQGAPGYFCFLNTIAISTLLAGREDNILRILITPLQAILLVEFGAIFLSAGLFKLVDCYNGNGMGFALGLLNPMWSKIFKHRSLINRFASLINFLGPCLQVAGGLLILSGIRSYMAIGYVVIGAMFISITPQTRLSWLCPAIAGGAYINHQLSISYSTSFYGVVTYIILVGIRLIVMRGLFREYFHQKSPARIIELTTSIYRKAIGVIIWKVFTFDIVRYICSRGVQCNDFAGIYLNASNTNVYDSISLVSLLCSKNYIDSAQWGSRMSKALEAFGLKSLSWVEILNETDVHMCAPSPSFLGTNKYSYRLEQEDITSLCRYRDYIERISVDSYASYKRVGS